MIIGNLAGWYRSRFSPALELIEHFVSQVEPQIEDANRKYQSGRKDHTEVYRDDDGREYGQRVETYENLDSMSWDMKALFDEHFPNLQRRSALITVYSSFEFEFFELCSLFQSEKHLKVAATDLSGKGISQCVNYLEKVGQLDARLGSHSWQMVNHIRAIRNMIVHRDGRRLDAKGKRPKKEIAATNQLKGLLQPSEIEVMLGPKFVPEAVRTFESYFKLVDESIQKSLS
jgi:hypothetical protein